MEGQRILVGVDGSEIAREALRWAMGLAERLGAEVVAAHAVGLLEDIHGDVPAGAWRAELRDLVEQTWCAPLARARCPHRVELRDGPAADVLLDVAATEHAGLLVVGSRGVGAAQPALALGSTSLRVLQIARLPVLVVPGRRERAPTGEVPELRHIVVGVDRSEPSLAALDLAADVAQLLGGSLSVLEVIEYVPPFPLGPSTTVTSAGEEDAPRRAMALLESAAQSIRERGVAVQVIVRSGDPAATLLEVADDVDADLVVVGTRGRGGPSEPMLGSVARTVAGRVRRPTLVLPGAAGAVRWGPPEQLPDAQATGTDS